MAAHCDSYWPCDSRTMRTARSMTPEENFGDFLAAPFSSEGASSLPGAIQFRDAETLSGAGVRRGQPAALT